MNKLGQFAAACVAVLFAFGACGSLFGETCTFNGSWDITPSGETDEIVIESGSLTWGAALPAKVARWTQTDGTVTFETVYGETGFTLFEVTGDVSLTGGKWTHKANSTTEAYRLAVSVGGSFTLGEDATIDVTACGYDKAGPGRVGAHCAGAYGGQGTGTNGALTPCYGSITKPVNLGSSGVSTHKGGGSVRLVVAGALTVNGRIFADGQTISPLSNYYGGSGGSIWVTASAIAGAGEISASASWNKLLYFGGGGRIALCLTGDEKDFGAFAGRVYAYPGRGGDSGIIKDMAAGTVYYETKADGEGQGRLVIDRGATDGTLTEKSVTDLILDDQEDSFNPSEIVLTNGATLRVTGGSRRDLTVGRLLVMDGKSKVILPGDEILDLTTASVVHTGAGEGLIQIFGSTIQATNGLTVQGGVNMQIVSAGTIEASAVTVASGGKITIDTPLTVTGDLTVEGGGVITHTVNTKDTDYRLTLNVGGDLVVDAGGKIDVSARGCVASLGLGTGDKYRGSSHGGRCYQTGETSKSESGSCYGSIVYPVDLGSGIYPADAGAQAAHGGGAAKLTVAGALTVNGSILAYGTMSSIYYNATGGSIWITAGSFVGTEPGAVISASASDREKTFNYNLSGGGRVAIHLTDANADFSGYAGSIIAYGTKSSAAKPFFGGAGTVYLKTGAQAANEGTLIIDNGLTGTQTGGETEISADVLDKDVGSVIVRNGGRLKIFAGERLTVRGDWDVPVNGFVSEPNAALVFAGTDASHVINGLMISDFICQTPGKEIVFGDGTTLTIAAGGRFQVEGDDEQDVTLRSETAETPWYLVVDASAAQSVNRVSVADCDATGGAQISAVNSALTRTENWKNTTVIIGQTVTWTGAAGSAAWLAAGNWDAERAPLATDRLVIAPGAVQPVLSDDFTAMDLTVEEGATFDLNGKSFRTTGDLTVAGTVKTVRGGTFVANGAADFTGATVDTPWLALELAGDGKAVQNFVADGLAFDSVTVMPNAAGVTVADAFTVRRLACEADAAFALSFAPGITVSVEELLTLEGPIALASTTAGQAWNFAVTGVKGVSGGVTVSDCTADILTPPAVWTGAVSDDFNTSGNWSTGEVPDADDDVIIGAGTVKASAAIAVASLWLKDGANVAIDKGAAVARSVYLSSGATLTHSANGNAGGNSLIVDIGGNLAVEEKAAIDVSYKGYPSGRGPDWASGTAGGTYAGRGIATANDQVEGKTYGSLLWPTDLGAGGNSYPGGGAAILTVAGVSRIDGGIKATGRGSYSDTTVGYGYYTGSGGSVALRTTALLGAGDIGADGGDYKDDYAGSGGRVAVILTGAGETFDEFGDSIHAYAGLKASVIPAEEQGTPGTIYLETAADGAGKGRVLIRNLPGAKVGIHNKPMLDYPVQKRTSSPKEAKDATFVLENLFDINLVSDAVMGDLYIKGTKTKIYLNGHTLRIRTDRHDIFDADEEARWAAQIIPGEDAEGNPGKIIWKQGLLLMVR